MEQNLWRNRLSRGWSLVQTSDGGYALAGVSSSNNAGNSDFRLIKTDVSGNIQWSKIYGGKESDQAYSLVQTNDMGYALAGFTNSYGAGGCDFWLVKTDSSGNMQWNKTYGGKRQDDEAYSVVQTSDGGYALAGKTVSYGAGDHDFWLVKTDASGNMLWSKTYGGPNNDEAYSVVQTSDGGYALAGTTVSNGNSNFLLVKIDFVGNMQWNKTYGGGTQYVTASFVVQANDGGYALAGLTISTGTARSDFWLIKTDKFGNQLWAKTYGGPYDDYVESLVQTSDGGYAMAGTTYTWSSGSEALLVKTDGSGNQLWNKTYGGEGWYYAQALVQTSDGGYALAGSTSYSNSWATTADIWSGQDRRQQFCSRVPLILRNLVSYDHNTVCNYYGKEKIATRKTFG